MEVRISRKDENPFSEQEVKSLRANLAKITAFSAFVDGESVTPESKIIIVRTFSEKTGKDNLVSAIYHALKDDQKQTYNVTAIQGKT